MVTTDIPKAKILGDEKKTRGSTVTYEIMIKAGKKTGKVILRADGKAIKTE